MKIPFKQEYCVYVAYHPEYILRYWEQDDWWHYSIVSRMSGDVLAKDATKHRPAAIQRLKSACKRLEITFED